MKKQENLLKENSITIDGIEVVRNNLTMALHGFHDPSDKAIKLFEEGNWVFSLNFSERQIEVYSSFYGYLAAYVRDSDLHVLKKDDRDLKRTLTKVKKLGKHKIENSELFVVLDGYIPITYGYYESNNVIDVKYANINYNLDEDSFKGHVLKKSINDIEGDTVLVTSTFYFSYNTFERIFYVRDQKHLSERIPVVKQQYDQSSFHFEIRHSKTIGKTDAKGNIKLSTINNYNIPHDEDKLWMFVVDKEKTKLVPIDNDVFMPKRGRSVDIKPPIKKKALDQLECGYIYFFKGLKTIAQIEVDKYAEFTYGDYDVITPFSDVLIELGLVKFKKNNKFYYLYDFAELSVLDNDIYVNGEKIGHVEHLQGNFLNPDNRSIIKLSKTYDADKLKKIRDVVQKQYPDRDIVYYLKEELV